MKKLYQQIYFSPLLFYLVFTVPVLFLLGFFIPFLYLISWYYLIGLTVAFLLDLITLFAKVKLTASRNLAAKFSNSDANTIHIQLMNECDYHLQIKLIDEVPIQFQKRDFEKHIFLDANSQQEINYELIPKKRGVYIFGKLHCFASTKLGLLQRRFSFDGEKEVLVYPSFVQMKEMDFYASHHMKSLFGFKKVRRIGHTLEFEQIKDYVVGDDIRTINWKATAKQRRLMVNQFQDEKSQDMYCLLDAGKNMKMPFDGLSLLDYSINSCLALTNVALKRKDKVGMLQFSSQVSRMQKANNQKSQLRKIMESLYQITPDYAMTDFAQLYAYISRKITKRSLLILYTNFEHKVSLERQLLYLKAIDQKHELILVFFKNTEVEKLRHSIPQNTNEIYDVSIAEDLMLQKQEMIYLLKKNGIQAILTAPEELQINVINKYLEIKARG